MAAAVSPPPPSGNPPPPPLPPQFSNGLTSSTGIRFVHGVVNPTHSKAEMFGGGVAGGDYDGDGDVDLYVVRGNIGPNLLYRNDGNNRFTDVAAAAGVAHANPQAAVTCTAGPPSRISTATETSISSWAEWEATPACCSRISATARSVTSPSIRIANHVRDEHHLGVLWRLRPSTATRHDAGALGNAAPAGRCGRPRRHRIAWRNDTDAVGIRFTKWSVEAGIAATIIARRGGYLDFQPNALDYDYTFTPTFARMNADRHPDILERRRLQQHARIHEQRRSSPDAVTFRDATDNAVIIDRNGMGSAVGDVDNDGDLDWFVTGIFGGAETVGNRLYRNDGTGVLQDVTVAAGVQDGGWGWAACLADFNLDGRLDIFHTNGWVNASPTDRFEDDRSRLFMSRANGLTFVDEAPTRGMTDTEQGRGVVCADFDNDGDVDIFMTNRGRENSGAFWLNDDKANTNRSLSVRLAGVAPNTEAVGARIRVRTGGATQMREIIIGNNFTSQNPTAQIFGLGAAATAETVEIEWPDGTVDTYANVQAGGAVFHQ